MKLRSVVKSLISLCLVLSIGVASANTKIEKIAPSSVGIEPKQLMLMYDSLMTCNPTEIHHVVVMVDGKIAGEIHPKPFRAEHSHTLYSVSKTFTAVAVGLLIDDGLLTVEDKLVKFYPEYIKDEIDPYIAFLDKTFGKNAMKECIEYLLRLKKMG